MLDGYPKTYEQAKELFGSKMLVYCTYKEKNREMDRHKDKQTEKERPHCDLTSFGVYCVAGKFCQEIYFRTVCQLAQSAYIKFLTNLFQEVFVSSCGRQYNSLLIVCTQFTPAQAEIWLSGRSMVLTFSHNPTRP